MWWLIFFFSGHKIPFPLGNSPGSCRGIFLFPLLLLPRIVFKSSMRYEENCNINTSSGHLYPSHKKKRQRTWILLFPVTSSVVIAFFQHSTYLTSIRKDAKAIIRHSWPWIQEKEKQSSTFLTTKAHFRGVDRSGASQRVNLLAFMVWVDFFTKEKFHMMRVFLSVVLVLFLRCLPCCESHPSVTLSSCTTSRLNDIFCKCTQT